MEEKLIIQVPVETEEQKKIQQDFKMTLDVEIFSKFFGLWLMKFPIPEDICEYVKTHNCPQSLLEVKHSLSIILGAPDVKDYIVRQMVFKEIL